MNVQRLGNGSLIMKAPLRRTNSAHPLQSAILAACTLAIPLALPAAAQTMLVDFGLTNGTNVGPTSSPDTNGNYWNNFASSNPGGNAVASNVPVSLVSTGNLGTGITMTLTSSDIVSANGNQNPAEYNAPLGSVSNTNLAVMSAVEDFWYSNTGNGLGTFTLSNLNPNETYDFSILSYRPNTSADNRTGTFTATGSNSSSVNVNATGTSNFQVSGTTYYGNLNTVQINGITTSSSNSILLNMSYKNNTGSVSFILNAIQLTGYVPYKDGATHNLDTAKAYSGNTILDAATVVNANATGALGSGTSALEVGSGGGTLNLTADQTVSSVIGSGNLALATGTNTLTVNVSSNSLFSVLTGSNGSTLTGANANVYSGTLSGSGTVAKTGSGNLTLSGSNSFTGTVSLVSGTLTLGNSNALKSATLSTGYGGTRSVAFASGTNNIGAITGNVALDISSNTLAVGSGLYDGALSGSGSLIKSGGGTLTVRGNNPFTGTVTVPGGTLQIADDGAANGGEIAGVTSVTNNASLAWFTANNNHTFGGNISGIGSISKNGSQTLTLAGNVSCSGTTNVTAGTLVVSGSVQVTPLKVGSSGTLQVASGGLVDGDNTIVSGAFALQSGGTYKFNIGTNGSSNAITGSGSVSLDGKFVFNLASADSAMGSSWNVAPTAASYTSNFSVVDAANSTAFTNLGNGVWEATAANGATYSFNELTGQLLVIPEPAGSVLVLSGISMLLGSRRRRRSN